LFQSGFTDLC